MQKTLNINNTQSTNLVASKSNMFHTLERQDKRQKGVVDSFQTAVASQ